MAQQPSMLNMSGQPGQMTYAATMGQPTMPPHMVAQYQTNPSATAAATGALAGGQVASLPTGASGYQPQALQQQLQYQHLQQQHQQQLQSFWQQQMREVEQANDFKNHQLPLARIKKIMKADEDVRMISAEAPVVFAKACEMFILELTLRSWIHTEENKRRTLQKNDIAGAITRTDIFDFLVDIVPRDELREEGGVVGNVGVGTGAAATALGGVQRPPVGMPGAADLQFGGMYYMPQGTAPTAASMQQPSAAIMQHQMMVGRPAMGMDPALYGQQQHQQQQQQQQQRAAAAGVAGMGYMQQMPQQMWQQQGMPPVGGSMPPQ